MAELRDSGRINACGSRATASTSVRPNSVAAGGFGITLLLRLAIQFRNREQPTAQPNRPSTLRSPAGELSLLAPCLDLGTLEHGGAEGAVVVGADGQADERVGGHLDRGLPDLLPFATIG